MGPVNHKQLFMNQQSLVPTKVNPKQPLVSIMSEFPPHSQGWFIKKNKELNLAMSSSLVGTTHQFRTSACNLLTTFSYTSTLGTVKHWPELLCI